MNPRRAGLGGDQAGHLRVVEAPDFVLVEEIGDFGVVAGQGEALAVEVERAGDRPGVADGDPIGGVGASALDLAAGEWRHDGGWPRARVHQIGQVRLDPPAGEGVMGQEPGQFAGSGGDLRVG
jgi:hypothetical protein